MSLSYLLFGVLGRLDREVDVLHGALDEGDGVGTVCVGVHTHVTHDGRDVPVHRLQFHRALLL